MIIARRILQKMGMGPSFDVGRVIFVEPMIIAVGMLVIRNALVVVATKKKEIRVLERGKCWTMRFVHVVFRQSFLTLSDDQTLVETFMPMLLTRNDASAVANSSAATATTLHTALLINSAVVGSTITPTSSLSGFLAVTLSYDDILWMEYLQNFILP
mmetsp:Transcript_20923/g.31929  ORF Transcript_20923/g.31929 Transcript_20923/m.31929 type:complete len:157 (+) Transcript_20923:230-700(+)